MGEPVPLGDLSLALRAHADVAAMTEVLTTSLADVLPDDVVTVERRRSAADRLAARPGTPVALTFRTGDRRLSLRVGSDGRPEATSELVVRGVRLSQQAVDLDRWIAALAEELQHRAAVDARSREAIYRFLLG